ncbi:MAG TPA: hypothetical protein DCS67_05185 [Clostridiales bacterium UBA8960]|nr:hypothetical protein [Clostridiales bacterium UBA8960]
MFNEFIIIAFSSTHQAIHFEKLLMGHYAIELIPTPRDVSASCGLSLKFEVDDMGAILEELSKESKEGLQLLHVIVGNSDQKIIPLNWER